MRLSLPPKLRAEHKFDASACPADAARSRKAYLKVAAVIPAFNEEHRIGAVLKTLTASPEVTEIIVVSDGSTDKTYEAASAIPGVQAIQLPTNKGKGGAMRTGALKTDADVLLFFDADLIGLTPQHVHDILQPILTGESTMSMGIFQGGRWATDIAQYFSPGITGQRAILREVFLQIPNLENVGYGIELAITYYVRHHDMIRKDVILRGVTHPMKEEKLGWIRGAGSRMIMYWQMLRFRISYELFGRPPRIRKKK
ncbi:MAG: glycosyl transferase family 2 [Capsulimonas sp.]|nr:glycosyl transferase family 2 [Capsulimonas sp.]